MATVAALFSPAARDDAAAQSITIDPPNPSITLGQTQQFTAPGISNAVDIQAGDYHACIVLQDGEARCSGDNNAGQLGNGSLVNSASPVAVASVSQAAGVSSGGFHSCAVLRDGTVRCWGRNDEGQLGDGSVTSSTTPVAVAGISTAIAVAAGYHHTCALLQDGRVKCWGDDSYGELGDGALIDQNFPRGGQSVLHSSVPVTVIGIDNAVSVTASDGYHSCAALQDGTVRCWGDNTSGQLGDGRHTRSSVPVGAVGIGTAVAVSSGDFHTCALLQGGGVACWGLNYSGQLGDGTGTDSATPVGVSGISTAVGISVGVLHTCAVLQNGTARCWGYNSNGQLGDGTTTNALAPVTVGGITTGTGAIAAGNNDSCAVLRGGVVKCWGMNTYGELGIGTTADASSPASVVGINATWTSSDPGVATIDDTGLATSVAIGHATITATFGAASGSTTLDVLTLSNLTIVRNGNGTVTSTPAGIDCGPACSTSFDSTITATLTAVPLDGALFAGWNGCDAASGSTCTVAMSADRLITAAFSRPTLTLTKSGPGRGSVTSSTPGLDCGEAFDTCTSSFDAGTALTLTATPAYGSDFDHWTACDPNGRFCSLTMDASKPAGATFTLSKFVLTVDKPGVGTGTVTASSGAIDCGDTCAAPYDYGTVVTLTATPGLGSVFNRWAGCDSVSDQTCTVTIGADTWVSANFLGVPMP
ncbi:MAG TPA: Ig-like domain-containing protein [Vicinamibacterales bacterium]|nr:Ig-like domain-containing protein [Vicinamibacterales bacterium]